MLDGQAASRNLVQSAKRQAATGQSCIESSNAK